MTSEHRYSQAVVERSKLAQVLRGGERPHTRPLQDDIPVSFSPKEVNLVWNAWSNRPCALIVNDDELNEFLSWLYAYHVDLTPITSWTHLFCSSEWTVLRNRMDISPEFFGLEAAWTGAIISEAMSNAGRDYKDLSLASCVATSSFAIARAFALYGPNYARILVVNPPRSNLRPYSDKASANDHLHEEVLLKLTDINQSASKESRGSDRFLEILRLLHLNEGKVSHPGSAGKIAELFSLVPNTPAVPSLSAVSAEDLIRLLRVLRENVTGQSVDTRGVIVFLAGLIIAQVGGAERDLRLADQFQGQSQNVRLWAMVIGGLGSEFYWSNAFAGLGRLIARELTRPVHLADAPASDIAYNELGFIEKSNPNGILKFRSANRNILNVSLKAGVHTGFYPAEAKDNRADPPASSKPSSVEPNYETSEIWRDVDYGHLARKLIPHLKPMITSEVQRLSARKSTRKNQPELKLKD